MKLYYSGSEIKSWRNLLDDQGIHTMALSYVGLSRRLKSTDNWKISSVYPEDADIFLDSGAYTFNREGAEFSVADAQAVAGSYMAFVQANIDSVSLVSEFDAQILGTEGIQNYRESFFNTLPSDKFMPIWHSEYGIHELESLCSLYEVVGIRQSEMRDTTLIPVFNSLIRRYNVRLHGVAITGKKMMRSVPWDSVSSTSWLSPSVYGDTLLWIPAMKDLKRFPKGSKDKRRSYRHVIEENGFDYSKIDADDPTELLKLSLWSWENFVRALTTNDLPKLPNSSENRGKEVDTLGSRNQNGELVSREPVRRDTVLIPLMGTRFQENTDTKDLEPILFKRSESMRVCNTCVLKDKCPGFKVDANCLYNIPLEIKTKEQLRNLQDTLLEMQTHRVLFMQMAEDLDGGYADPNLSQELDRLQRMIKAKTDAERAVFDMRITATEGNQSSGLMDKFLGKGNADKLRALESPVRADDVIKDSEIYDAVVLDA